MIPKILIALFLAGQAPTTTKGVLSTDPAYYNLLIQRKQAQIQQDINEQAFYKAAEVRATQEKIDIINLAKKNLKLDSSWTWDDKTNSFTQGKK